MKKLIMGIVLGSLIINVSQAQQQQRALNDNDVKKLAQALIGSYATISVMGSGSETVQSFLKYLSESRSSSYSERYRDAMLWKLAATLFYAAVAYCCLACDEQEAQKELVIDPAK